MQTLNTDTWLYFSLSSSTVGLFIHLDLSLLNSFAVCWEHHCLTVYSSRFCLQRISNIYCMIVYHSSTDMFFMFLLCLFHSCEVFPEWGTCTLRRSPACSLTVWKITNQRLALFAAWRGTKGPWPARFPLSAYWLQQCLRSDESAQGSRLFLSQSFYKFQFALSFFSPQHHFFPSTSVFQLSLGVDKQQECCQHLRDGCITESIHLYSLSGCCGAYRMHWLLFSPSQTDDAKPAKVDQSGTSVFHCQELLSSHAQLANTNTKSYPVYTSFFFFIQECII